jgi:hypothetical protein
VSLLLHSLNAAITTTESADNTATAFEQLQLHVRAAIWLLHKAPKAATAAGVADNAVRIPGMPLQWAMHLLEAGVRISYTHLLAAAKSMVAGVEVWVLAWMHLGIPPTDIPAAALAICCRGCWVSLLLACALCSDILACRQRRTRQQLLGCA